VFAVARHIRVDGVADGRAGQSPHGAGLRAHSRQRIGARDPHRQSHLFAQAAGGCHGLEMRLSPAGDALYVLCQRPRQLVRLALDPMRVDWTLPLPDDPADFDISPDGIPRPSAPAPDAPSLSSILPTGRSFPPMRTTGEIGLVRFQPFHGAARAQSDSRQLIAANVSQRMLSIFDVPSRRLIVNLPLAVRPDHLCFKPTAGRCLSPAKEWMRWWWFIPTTRRKLGRPCWLGHSPGAMAPPRRRISFRGESQVRRVSILDIETSKVLAVTPVGTEPSCIAITPDDQYALVLNQASGDMAVIRIKSVTAAAHWKKGPLFMLIPVGSKPVSAAVVRV
jgi:hypothetical protein